VKKLNQKLLASYHSQDGQSLASLSIDPPLLLVFLRHFG
jgi:hypothetical protein